MLGRDVSDRIGYPVPDIWNPGPCPQDRSSVLGIRPPASVRLQVSGTRHRVPATWHLVPETEPNAHTGFASCIHCSSLLAAHCLGDGFALLGIQPSQPPTGFVGELQRPTAEGKQFQKTFLALPIPFPCSFC